jgi:hypothetical protein
MLRTLLEFAEGTNLEPQFRKIALILVGGEKNPLKTESE